MHGSCAQRLRHPWNVKVVGQADVREQLRCAGTLDRTIAKVLEWVDDGLRTQQLCKGALQLPQQLVRQADGILRGVRRSRHIISRYRAAALPLLPSAQRHWCAERVRVTMRPVLWQVPRASQRQRVAEARHCCRDICWASGAGIPT